VFEEEPGRPEAAGPVGVESRVISSRQSISDACREALTPAKLVEPRKPAVHLVVNEVDGDLRVRYFSDWCLWPSEQPG